LKVAAGGVLVRIEHGEKVSWERPSNPSRSGTGTMEGTEFMSVPRLPPRGVVLAAVLGLVGCHETVGPSSGWGLTNLPDTQPDFERAMAAARAVVQDRYPMSGASDQGGFLVALTPVVMDGGSKTRKEISVFLRRNFTGAYDPVVRIRKFVDVATPELRANPESANAARAMPVVDNEWHALDYLPYEEQELYDAILEKIASLEGSPPAERPAPEGARDVPADTAPDAGG
jgi:hypothetical protein